MAVVAQMSSTVFICVLTGMPVMTIVQLDLN